MEKQNNHSYIAIPKEMLYDETISPKAKYLYIMLKKHSYDDNIRIKYSKLMKSLQWSDKRTLKRYLSQLNGSYIYYDFKCISEYKPIEILMPFTKPFIQIDRELIEKALSIESHKHEQGLLYMYLMEDQFNIDWGYSCPSIRDIQKITKLNNKTLKEIIWLYHINYICEYCQGDKINLENNRRFRNRYILNNIDYSGDNQGKRRYKKHKPEGFFFSEDGTI